MSDRDRVILDAAYACFTRHGVKRTTMDDLAREAGMSRPALYQYYRSKDAIFRALVSQLLTETLASAEQAAATEQDLTSRLTGILSAKLGLLARLWRDSPAHAAELLSPGAAGSGDLVADYERAMVALLVAALETEHGQAPETAALLLAFTRGLDVRADASATSLDRLRRGVAIFVAGLDTLTTTPPPTRRDP